MRGERNCSAEQSTIYRWNREKLQLECQVLQMEKEAEKESRTEGEPGCRCAGN